MVSFTDTSSPAAQYLWDFGDGNTSMQQNPVHTYVNPGNYTVTLTVSSGSNCSGSRTDTNYIEVYAAPVAGFIFDPQTITLTEPVVQFTDRSRAGNMWDWNFGDSTTSTDQNPIHEYPDTGAYIVSLIVTTDDGCVDSIKITLFVQDISRFWLPNAFTPNGDGRNDTFGPAGHNINFPKYNMWIFDRWGLLIYTANSTAERWDGKYEGGTDIVQEDVYVYLIKYTDLQGEEHFYVGNVNLIR
jgi:gliding motility-associated-like protein